MKIEATTASWPHGPWCGFKTGAAKHIGQHRLKYRLADLERKGLSPNVCGAPAVLLLDGAPHCRRHAGEALLRARIGPPVGGFGAD